jgi:hypothetical protein
MGLEMGECWEEHATCTRHKIHGGKNMHKPRMQGSYLVPVLAPLLALALVLLPGLAELLAVWQAQQ